MGKPKSDPAIGQAAAKSAQTGQDYLEFMKGQSGITNQWAAEDRARYKNTFQPLQDKYIADAAAYASPDRMAARVDQAQAGVQTQLDNAKGGMMRSLTGMGVNPNSGRFAESSLATDMNGALAIAGAGNAARGAVRGEAQQMQGNAINMGSGMAVNPGTSMGLSNGAMSAGANGAMQGYNQQSNILQQQDQVKQQASSSLWGGIGSIAGMVASNPAMLAFASDKNLKENVKPVGRSLLKAVESMPVKDWQYKDGAGDGGRHIGTMSQDFKKQTGMGDGKTINVIDAIGTVMGAVQELSKEVSTIKRTMPAAPALSSTPAAAPAARPASRGRSLPDMKVAA